MKRPRREPRIPLSQILAELTPQRSEEDSVVRDLLTRVVHQHGPLVIDIAAPTPIGRLEWRTVVTEAGTSETSIYYMLAATPELSPD